mmetsp:Transcript_22140/g.87837  ORF Transcript_22140/g.87837 Transcript_22140/m.87837 type:complete len:229 (-) Transcript_22140:47-733(-)
MVVPRRRDAGLAAGGRAARRDARARHGQGPDQATPLLGGADARGGAVPVHDQDPRPAQGVHPEPRGPLAARRARRLDAGLLGQGVRRRRRRKARPHLEAARRVAEHAQGHRRGDGPRAQARDARATNRHGDREPHRDDGLCVDGRPHRPRALADHLPQKLLPVQEAPVRGFDLNFLSRVLEWRRLRRVVLGQRRRGGHLPLRRPGARVRREPGKPHLVASGRSREGSE